MSADKLIEIVKEAFKCLEDPSSAAEDFSKFFSEKYIQHVDGKTLNYTQFLEHVSSLKSRVHDIKITIEHIFSKNNKVCSVHYAEAKTENGSSKTKVVAYYEFENKISSDVKNQISQLSDDILGGKFVVEINDEEPTSTF